MQGHNGKPPTRQDARGKIVTGLGFVCVVAVVVWGAVGFYLHDLWKMGILLAVGAGLVWYGAR